MMKILSNREVEDDSKTSGLQHARNAYTGSDECHTFESIPYVSITSAGTEGEQAFSESSEFIDERNSDLGNNQEFENSGDTNLLSSRCGCDSETESVISDYSEMADPVKEHLANVQIAIDRFSSAAFVVQPKLFRRVGESEEEFLRRIRKTNFLSLAQEFAELKKQNASALPFNLHEERYKNNRDSEEEADEVDEFSAGSLSIDKSKGQNDSGCLEESDDHLDLLKRMTVLLDCKIDFDCRNDVRDHVSGLEECDMVDNAGHSLCNSACESGDVCNDVPPNSFSIISALKSDFEEKNPLDFVRESTLSQNCALRCSSSGCRDDICRKLATTNDEKWLVSSGNSSEFLIKMENECDLELCYVNEEAEDLDLSGHCSDGFSAEDFSAVYDLEVNGPELRGEEVEDDILSRQAFLEMKARLALAQVRPAVDNLAKSEVLKTKSAFSYSGEWPSLMADCSRFLSRQKLEQMSIAELQIIANNLCERIEALNCQLVVDLLQRDDLHMVQDSMLVEIEDLTGRAKEYASKVDHRNHNKQNAKFI